ncbi:MAG: hypothetical protein ACLRXQ_06405 [Phascolarctobacterium faecium]
MMLRLATMQDLTRIMAIDAGYGHGNARLRNYQWDEVYQLNRILPQTSPRRSFCIRS